MESGKTLSVSGTPKRLVGRYSSSASPHPTLRTAGRSPAMNLILTAFLACAVVGVASAQTDPSERRRRGEAVIDRLTLGKGQPALEAVRETFPFLADATTDYALGDVWGRTVLDDRTRQLATVAAFAATGNLPQLKVHARYALDLGVPADELKEIVYLTTVHAGFARALDAAGALAEVFDSRGDSESTSDD